MWPQKKVWPCFETPLKMWHNILDVKVWPFGWKCDYTWIDISSLGRNSARIHRPETQNRTETTSARGLRGATIHTSFKWDMALTFTWHFTALTGLIRYVNCRRNHGRLYLLCFLYTFYLKTWPVLSIFETWPYSVIQLEVWPCLKSKCDWSHFLWERRYRYHNRRWRGAPGR